MIDRWLVRDAGNGGWFFLARLPASRAMRLQRIVVAAAAAAVVAIVMFASTASAARSAAA